jgi:hypothetical protein
MTEGSRGRRVALTFVVLLVASMLSACGDHSAPAADRCSRQARPAGPRTQVNWDGVHLKVPVGWYPVSVCFSTGGTPVPVGYMTTQTPHAQCSGAADSTGGRCHPPVDQLGDKDVLVFGGQTSRRLMRKLRPNTTLAGRPARVTTSPGEGTYGESKVLNADLLFPHREVLEVTAYLGPSASAKPIITMLEHGRLRPEA